MTSIQLETISINLIGSSSLSASEDCCIYLVSDRDSSNSSILIDTGAGSDRSINAICRNMEAINPVSEVCYILVTHAHIDHVGGLRTMKSRLPQAKVIAHTYAADVIRKGDPVRSAAKWYNTSLLSAEIDIEIGDTFKKPIGKSGTFQVLHTPGHTPGSVVGFLTSHSAYQSVLFGQDIHGPFMSEFNSDIDRWRQSMETLLGLEADYLCEGHFGIIEGKKNVREFIKGYLRRYSYANS
ncbi:MAG: MBL fold metallo-hydrolase [Candidatus Heimdallarchaeota archaeon]|nr:MAG: MBL fold metallo-hydrolase [Candidatus Heimdallarchaeota archaeon]